jgi:YHS domain-containing protein
MKTTITLALISVSLLCLVTLSDSIVPHRLARRFSHYRHIPLKEGDKTLCPVSGQQITITKNTPTYTWQGKTYYFCCETCREKFIQNPQIYSDQPHGPEFLFEHPHD